MARQYQTCELEVELDNIFPRIWRHIDVDAATTLRQLHHIIQIAFGWETKHLHQFMIDRDIYTDASRIIDSPRWRYNDDKKTTLADIARAGLQFRYIYDFGDDWLHTIHVKSIVSTDAPLKHAVLRKAEFAGPVEDCGGVPDFIEVMTHFLRNDGSPEHIQARRRLEEFGPMVPGYCDERAINAALVRLAQNGGGRK